MSVQPKYTTLTLLPPIGILLFTILYIYATSLYPGGSQADEHSVGFSWMHNYWCNLMSETSINGQTNPASPIAISAMAVLCFSLMIFFIQFAQVFTKRLIWKRIISLGGIGSMLCAMFIFTSYHDLMTILSSVFGLFVVIGILKEIYQHANRFYKLTGLGCLLLLGLNNFIYYSGIYLNYLPLLQKITFAIVLLWIVALNNKIYSLSKHENDQ